MAIVYNSNQVKWGGRGYLDAKMQPVATPADLPNDIAEVFEGMTVVVLDDGTGNHADYWRVNGAWVKKATGGGGGDCSALIGTGFTTAHTVTDAVEDIESQLENTVTKDVDDLTNYYKKSEVYTKDEVRTELDEAIDAAADYTDEQVSALTAAIEGKQDAFETGGALQLENGILSVLVDGTTIKIDENTNKLHVIGGGSGSTQYIPGQYISIEDDVISVTGITPDEYATKQELEVATEETRIGAIVAATAWTVNQGYAKEEDVIDTVADLLQKIDEAEANAITASSQFATEYVDGKVEEVNEEMEGLVGEIGMEISRATGVEAELAGKLTSVETGLTEANAQIAEISAATEDVATKTWVSEQVNAEEQRAMGVEGELYSAITTSRDAIQAEIERATSEELALGTELEQEIARAQSAESINASAIHAEVERATGVEDGLSSEIASEIARATQAEGGLSSDIEAEENRAKSAETALDFAINAESQRAARAEGAITELLAKKADASALTDYATEEWVNEQGFLKEHQHLPVYKIENETPAQGFSAAYKLTSDGQDISGSTTINIPSGSVLSEDLTTDITVGHVAAGTTFTAGTSIEEIIRKIFISDAPVSYSYVYYGSLDFDNEFYQLSDYTEENVKSKLTRSTNPVSTEPFIFTINTDDYQILVAVPTTYKMKKAYDIDNNINYTSEFDTVSLTIDGTPYTVYHADFESGMVEFDIEITLQNA